MGSIAGGGGNLQAARGSEVSSRGSSSIDYKIVPAAGFEILPTVIRSRLVAEGVIGTRALCASCQSLEVKRRADGTHYQTGTAWWGDESRAVLIECRREMEHRGGKKYSPSGAWSVTGVIHHLQNVGGPEVTKWKFRGGASAGDEPSPLVVTRDPLDLLPPEVVTPIRGGLSDVWMLTTSSSAKEYLTAIRVVNDQVLLLEANRTARTETSLHLSEWTLTTLAAPIIQSESFTCVSAERDRALGEEGRPDSKRNIHPLIPGT